MLTCIKNFHLFIYMCVYLCMCIFEVGCMHVQSAYGGHRIASVTSIVGSLLPRGSRESHAGHQAWQHDFLH